MESKIPLLKDITKKTLQQINYSFEYVTPEIYQILFYKNAKEENLKIDLAEIAKDLNEKIKQILVKEKKYEKSLNEVIKETDKAIIGIEKKDINLLKDIQVSLQNLSKTYKEELEKLYFDDLTEVYNRKGLYHYLEEEEYLPFNGSFYVFDMNNLKIVNDTYGHLIGDTLIKAFSKFVLKELTKNIPEKEKILSRYGGDEFIALIHEKNRDYFENKLKSFISKNKKLKLKSGDLIDISFVYGREFFDKGDLFSEIFEKSDKKMYIQKQLSKNK